MMRPSCIDVISGGPPRPLRDARLEPPRTAAGERRRPPRHAWPELLGELHGIDNADDGRIDRTVLEAGGHAGRAAAHNEDSLADAGVDRIDGHEVLAVGLAAGIDRPRHEQLAADQAGVLSRGDDGPHDLRQQHGVAATPWPTSPCRWAARPRDSRAGAG